MSTLSNSSINFDGALPNEVYFDPEVKRFRYKGGSPGQPIRGTFISRKDALELQKKYLEESTKNFIALAPRIKSGEIGVYKEAGELLKKIHLSNAIIKADGFDRLTNSQLGTIGNILKKQYYAGKSENGKPYGLKHLFKEVQTSDVSEAALTNRLQMYARAGRLSGDVIQQESATSQGATEMRRILGKTDHHCKDCLRYSGFGWVGVGQLPIPGVSCQCGSNCLCTVLYR